MSVIDENDVELDEISPSSGELEYDDTNQPKRPFVKRLKKWLLFFCLIAFILPLLQIILYKYLFPPITPLMVHRWTQQLRTDNRPVVFKRDYVKLDKISPNMVKAVIASEDGRYLHHKGFDVKQLKISYKQNKEGRRVRGGSTISMQTAKNVFLSNKRTYLRKAFEAIFTVAIENIWGKKRIMEVYLNVIEFGDGIYGVEAASQHYFGHSAASLTEHEAAQLAVLLPAPLKRNLQKPSSFMLKYTRTIESRMRSTQAPDWNNLPKPHNNNDESLFDFILWMLKQK